MNSDPCIERVSQTAPSKVRSALFVKDLSSASNICRDNVSRLVLVVALQTGNALSLVSADERRREKARVVVRPTSKPREVLVDTSGIFGNPGDFSEPTTPAVTDTHFSTQCRLPPFQPPDLK
jgi:hypothetical protein